MTTRPLFSQSDTFFFAMVGQEPPLFVVVDNSFARTGQCECTSWTTVVSPWRW